jgi:glycosyltransferase involved in cell wall biosynthesis
MEIGCEKSVDVICENTVSVIVPMNNNEQTILRCLDSLSRQKYVDIEIIVVDDGSIDNSASICKEYIRRDSRLKYAYQEKSGPAIARNKGIELSIGRWICFVDADDWVDSSYVGSLARHAVARGVVIGGIKEENEEGEEVANIAYHYADMNRKAFFSNFALYRNSDEYTPLLHSPVAKLYDKKIILRNNIFFPGDLRLGEDYVFNLEYFSICDKVIIIEYNCYHYIIYDKSLSHRLSYSRLFDILYIVDYTRNYIENNKYILNKKQAFIKYKYNMYVFVAIMLIKNRNHYLRVEKEFVEVVRKNSTLGEIITMKNNHWKKIMLLMIKSRMYPIVYIIFRFVSIIYKK